MTIRLTVRPSVRHLGAYSKFPHIPYKIINKMHPYLQKFSKTSINPVNTFPNIGQWGEGGEKTIFMKYTLFKKKPDFQF